MEAVEILSGVLQFAVHSLVQILKKGDSGRFGSSIVRFDVLDEYGQALRAKPKLFRCRLSMPSLVQHDDGISRTHLSSAGWVAVTVALLEAEGLAEPSHGFLQVPVRDVRKHRVSGYRAI